MVRKLSFINYKGGVGKTSLVVNLAASLAEAGQRVLLVDLDAQSNSSIWLMRLERWNPLNTSDTGHIYSIFEPGVCRLRDCVTRDVVRDKEDEALLPGLDILPTTFTLVDLEHDFDSPDGRPAFAIFQEQLSEIEDDYGMVVLSKQKADLQLRWERVLSNYEEGSVVDGTIKLRVRGGLIVDIEGVEAFLPGSQIDVMPVHNTDGYIGQTFEFKILKISPERRNIIVSRRELIEETGYHAGHLEPLTAFYTSPGILSERMHAFLATDLVPGDQALEHGEQIDVEVVGMKRVRTLMTDGSIEDGKTLAVLGLYFLGSHQ